MYDHVKSINSLTATVHEVTVKVKAYLYRAFNETSPQGAQVWITQGCPCKLHHTCLYLANVRQLAPPEWQTYNSCLLLIYRPPEG